MNREIKFRGWDNINKKMYYPKDLFNLQGFFYEDDTEGELCGNQVIDSYGGRNRFVLLQYTGLKDKNGKEIYEGDIIAADEEAWEIVFDLGMFCVKHWSSKDEKLTPLYQYPDCEIIGNIYAKRP